MTQGIESYFNRATRYYTEGKYEEAIKTLTLIIKSDVPDDIKAGAYNNRGLAKHDLERYEEAIRDYDKAIELQPDYAAAYHNRGLAKNSLQRYEEAIKDYDKVIELQPEDAEAYHNRGVAKYDLQRYEEAIADYDKAIELQPKLAKAYYNRGLAKHDLERYEEAIADYDKAIELQSEDANAYNNRGLAKYNLERDEEAIRDYDKAIELQSEDAKAYYNRGLAKYNLERDEEAIRDYDKAIELQSEDANAYNNRGLAKHDLERYEEAIRDYDKAIELQPKLAKAYYNRGNAKCSLGSYEEAIEDYDKAIALQPDYAKAYNNRGNAKCILGSYEEAIADYDKAIELQQPKLAKAYYNRGNAYHEQAQYNKAIVDYTQVIKLPTDDNIKAGAYAGRGTAYAKQKEYNEAINDFNAALQYGISDEVIETYRKQEEKGIAKNILEVFASTAQILNQLKVPKDSKDTEYLSHTTGLPVFIQLLVPTHKNEKQPLGSFRMYHIAYTNDPTEGRVLFNNMNIPLDEATQGRDIPYVMVTSFCGGKDPQALDTLPIWKMYGDDAQGIGLLFKKSDIAYDKKGHAMPHYFESTMLSDTGNTNKKVTHATPQPLPNKADEKNVTPPQILYKVYYVKSDETDETKSDKIYGKLKDIKTNLETIQKQQDIHNKTLELLNGIRYLIKDIKYAYEEEYRLLCFANKEQVPKILQSQDITEQTESTKDTNTGSLPRIRIYIETEILKKLCKVITAPKVNKEQALNIQYLLHFYKEELPKLEEEPLYTSNIPYR